MREPWRNALAHLHTFLGWERVETLYSGLEAVQRLKQKPVDAALQMMERGVNAPPSSSAGKLFDAIAALLGVSFDAVSSRDRRRSSLRRWRPSMRRANEGYGGALVEGDPVRFDWTPMWCGILEDLAAGVDAPLIAARFHVGLAETLAGTAASLARTHGCKTIVLCGGVFQNDLLLEATDVALAARGVEVLSPALSLLAMARFRSGRR